MIHRAMLNGTLRVLVIGMASAALPAQAQPAPPQVTPAPSDPRNIEGVWNPHMERPKGKPGEPPSAPAPPAGAKAPEGGPGIAGRDETGAGIAAAVGSTLECTPIQRLSGASGGMSNLWIEGPDEIVMISEEDQDVRKFYLNAKHPAHVVPQPNGHSIAHWQGDTLVVDTIGYAKTDGTDSGEHTIERFHKTGNTLTDQVTIESGGKSTHKTYTADWRPDLRVWENVCEEGYQRYQLINGQVDSPDKPPTETK